MKTPIQMMMFLTFPFPSKVSLHGRLKKRHVPIAKYARQRQMKGKSRRKRRGERKR